MIRSILAELMAHLILVLILALLQMYQDKKVLPKPRLVLVVVVVVLK